MSVPYLFLVLGWVFWCLIHSLLIANSVTTWVHNTLPAIQFYYRLFFNLFSLTTLIPLILLTEILRGPVIFTWDGLLVLLRGVLLMLSVVLFLAGGKHYDAGYFLGLKQISTRTHHPMLAQDENFCSTGIFGITRHPWYLGGLLFLWSFHSIYYLSYTITAIILSLYLVIGTILEERKIVAEFGDEYKSYQKEVSMLIPWKYCMKKIRQKMAKQ